MDISPEQIAIGLRETAKKGDHWPPNAGEFRLLCLSDRASPDGFNTAAYLSFDDPKHPSNDPESSEYKPKPKGLTNDGWESKRQKAGKSALADMKNMFK